MSIHMGSVGTGSAAPSVRPGDELWHLGALLKFHVTGAETGGRFWIAEHWAPRGYGPALHTHAHEDELFVVLDGKLTMSVSGDRSSLEAGATAFGPRTAPHTFKVESPTARFLVLGSPAGFEPWFRLTGEPAAAPTLPPPDLLGDIEEIIGSAGYAEALRAYGVEVVGPALP
ncbi:cupin domain-containing protein [Streptomyces sp. URMC 127]|uniref:cupin domain-containing protein n=1 Tax=Streptomyces sp. URMC 127 TaxID=3423402 RepID=UPI003F1D7636